MCNNTPNRILAKNNERAIVGRFGNCQRTAGRCKAVVRTQPEFLSGVVDPKQPEVIRNASRSIRVRPLQRRSIKLTSISGERVLDEAVAVTLQRNKVVTRKLSSIFRNSRASRPYVLFEIRRGVFYYLKNGSIPAPEYIEKVGFSVSTELKAHNSNENSNSIQNVKAANQLRVRGVRGAISVAENKAEAIYEASATLVRTVFEVNQIDPEDVASIFFTTTRDLDTAFPALAVRRDLGLTDIPMMCSHEMDVEPGIAGALPRIIRVMFHINTTKSAAEIRHVYLREAAALRPDKALS